jgi:hypothetical protein
VRCDRRVRRGAESGPLGLGDDFGHGQVLAEVVAHARLGGGVAGGEARMRRATSIRSRRLARMQNMQLKSRLIPAQRSPSSPS